MTTWGEIRTELEEEYDLAEETFITADGLLASGNDAIEDIEAEIRAVCPDYFQTEAPLVIVANQATYDLPADIYGNAVKLLMYDNGSNTYEIKPIRSLSVIADVEPGDDFRYLITNSTASGTKLKLYPTPTAADSSSITMYYLRNAKRFEDDDSVLDVPEAKGFVKQYVMDRAVNKESMQPGAPESPALLKKRTLLLDALKVMLPDNNNDPLTGECPYSEQVGY